MFTKEPNSSSVLHGEPGIRYAEEEAILPSSDSVYFDASHPHGYRSAGPEQARAVVIATPPRL